MTFQVVGDCEGLLFDDQRSSVVGILLSGGLQLREVVGDCGGLLLIIDHQWLYGELLVTLLKLRRSC